MNLSKAGIWLNQVVDITIDCYPESTEFSTFRVKFHILYT